MSTITIGGGGGGGGPLPLSSLGRNSTNFNFNYKHHHQFQQQIRCSSSSRRRRGRNSSDSNSDSNTPPPPAQQKSPILPPPEKVSTSRQRNSTSPSFPTQAPVLSSLKQGQSKDIPLDLQFEQRLQAVRRSALDQKKAEEEREYGAIDYDAPVKSESSTMGSGFKIGVGVAVVVFGLVFALGDFLLTDS